MVFSNIDYEGNIEIHLALQDNFILCRITDNGIGYNNSNETTKQSVSTDLISEFILKATKTKIKILDKKQTTPNDQGMFVEFLIPYKLTEDD